jgi:hypothetical protein
MKDPEEHCIVGLEPLKEGQEESVASEMTCFTNFSEAIAAATGGAVQLPKDIDPSGITEEMLQSAMPAAQTIISVSYQHSNFGGSSLTHYANNTYGCTNGSSYFVSSLPSGWNDVISSTRLWGGCDRTYFFEHISFGGAALRVGPTTQLNGFGAMNDETSSIRWYRWAAGPWY